MPKQSDYSKGLIYKICCKDTKITDIYIGSTCNFTRRKYYHKGACNNEKHISYNFPLYKFIRDKGGWTNWNMVLVKYFPCNSRLELLQEEQIVIEEFGEYTTLNRIRTWRSEEYKKEQMQKISKRHYEDNKEEITKRHKKWQKNNEEKFQEYQKNWRKSPYTCLLCNRTVNRGSKSAHEKTKIHLENLQQVE